MPSIGQLWAPSTDALQVPTGVGQHSLETSAEMDRAIQELKMDSMESDPFNEIGLAENVDEHDEISFKKGDYLIAHSTISGFSSYRYQTSGSPFIRELVSAIKEHVVSDNINCEKLIRDARKATAKHQQSGSNTPQLPELISTLRADFMISVKSK